jgi:hypothetical protein
MLERDHLQELVEGHKAWWKLYLDDGVEVWLRIMTSQMVLDLLEGDHLQQLVDGHTV